MGGATIWTVLAPLLEGVVVEVVVEDVVLVVAAVVLAGSWAKTAGRRKRTEMAEESMVRMMIGEMEGDVNRSSY